MNHQIIELNNKSKITQTRGNADCFAGLNSLTWTDVTPTRAPMFALQAGNRPSTVVSVGCFQGGCRGG